LAVANAKSHPISVGGRHETAIAFLTDLEEKLDVAQVQLEIYNTLLPHVDDAPAVGERIKLLSKRLFTMTDVSDCRTAQMLSLISVVSSINNLLSPSISLPSSYFVCMFLNIAMKQWRAQSGIKYLKRVRTSPIVILTRY
jgi:hypothetical protein